MIRLQKATKVAPNGGVDAGERQHETTKSTKQIEKQAIEPRVQRFVMPAVEHEADKCLEMRRLEHGIID